MNDHTNAAITDIATITACLYSVINMETGLMETKRLTYRD